MATYSDITNKVAKTIVAMTSMAVLFTACQESTVPEGKSQADMPEPLKKEIKQQSEITPGNWSGKQAAVSTASKQQNWGQVLKYKKGTATWLDR